MDRETIIRMAEEAGLDPMQDTLCSFDGFEAQFTKFAQLVAAHAREEAAKLCDRFSKESHFTGHAFAGGHLAQKIRART